MPENQNTIIYLMLLNGILFLSLNFIANAIIFQGPKGSKRLGYTLILAVFSAFFVQQEFNALVFLKFNPQNATNILVGGFIIPVFFISLVYYRIRRQQNRRPDLNKVPSSKKKDENH